MNTSKELFLSLLSMDAYNRGYDEGIDGLTESGVVGGARIVPIDVMFNLAKLIRWQPVDDPLVLDLDRDGVIDDITELFGAPDVGDYTELAANDSGCEMRRVA